jgi:hypothetical protein
MRQVPNGPNGMVCPFHREAMSLVCAKCPLWVQIRGRHPQTGDEMDRYECAIALMPVLQIEVASQVRQGAAATESFRNEVVRRSDARHLQRQVMPALASQGDIDDGA